MTKGDGPWIAAAICAMALAVFLVCTLRVGWPLGRSVVVVAFGAGNVAFALLYVVSLGTNDDTRAGFRRRESIRSDYAGVDVQ